MLFKGITLYDRVTVRRLFHKEGKKKRGYDIQYLYYINRTIERHYRPCEIPKKGGGTRTLRVPDENLKAIQRTLMINHIAKIPVSQYATAYRRGSSAIVNAGKHVGQSKVLRLDIEDFFGSVTCDQVYLAAFNRKWFKPHMGKLLASLCCFHDSLPQGAPTSPALANIIMRPFDEHIAAWCAARGITYTRYCDDMTFSGDFNESAVISKVTGFLREMGFELNKSKTCCTGQGQRQIVTGITVNERLRATREYRAAIRQEMYYCKRFGLRKHLAAKGERDPDAWRTRMSGRIGYVLQIDPDDEEFRAYRDEIGRIQ